jgi:hypothetical protein
MAFGIESYEPIASDAETVKLDCQPILTHVCQRLPREFASSPAVGRTDLLLVLVMVENLRKHMGLTVMTIKIDIKNVK